MVEVLARSDTTIKHVSNILYLELEDDEIRLSIRRPRFHDTTPDAEIKRLLISEHLLLRDGGVRRTSGRYSV